MPTLPAAGYGRPLVPTVDPLAAPPETYQSVRADAGSFGAASAQALSGLGASAEKAAGSLFDIQDRYDKATADEQANAAMERVNKLRYGDVDDPNDVGFHGLVGKAAMERYKPYTQDVATAIQEGRAKLTPAQQRRFDERMRPYQQHAMSEAGAHYATSVREYQNKEAAASLKLNSSNASTAAAEGNQAAFERYTADSDKLVDDNPSLTPTEKESLKAQRKSEFARDWANGMIGREEYDAAERFIERNAGVLGDHATQLRNSLRPHRERAEARRLTGEILGTGAGPSSAPAGVVVRNGPVEGRIKTAAEAEGISPTLAMTVASIESNFGRTADRPGSQYRGVFQLGNDAAASVGGREVEHGVRFVANTRKELAGALGRDPADWEVYLAHQQGTGGAVALLSNPDKPAGQLLPPQHISANGGDPNAPASQFVQKWRNTYEQRAARLGAPGAASAPEAGVRTSTAPVPATTGGEITAVGDSLAAHLVRRAGAQGKEDRARVGSYREGDTAVSGWNPDQVLGDIIPKIPEAQLRGQTVALSTGISNATSGEIDRHLTETIPAQIAALRERGAKNIVLMGVGTDPKLAGVNDRLAQIAEQNKDVGVRFAGPQRATGGDRIHSTDQAAEMAAVRAALGTQPAAAPAAEPQPTTGSSTPPAGATVSRPNPFADTASPSAGQPISQPAATVPGRPKAADLDQNLAEVQRRVAAGTMSPEVAEKVESQLRHAHGLWQTQTAAERTAFAKEYTDSVAALADGKDVPLDTAKIDRLFPPDKAAEMKEVADDARTAGGFISTIRTSTQQDIAAQRQQLAALANDPTANNYARRAKLLKIYDEVVKNHVAGLAKDPSAYVANYSPQVKDLYQQQAQLAETAQATVPQDQRAVAMDVARRSFANYAHATLAEQERLGVPVQKRAILPEAEAANIAAGITRIDATTTDPVTAINQVAQRYGQGMGTNDYWPQVYGQLVTQGKLPGPYQVLGTMDREDQKVAAADLSRAMGVIAQKGGMAAVKAGATDQAKEIDKQIETYLEPFRLSTGPNQGGEQLYHTVQEAAQALAYYYAYRGESASNAATHAVDGIINHKYDFGSFGNNTVRVPKEGDQDMVRVTQRAAEQVQQSINADQLGPIPGSPTRTPAERKALWLEAIRNGGWANNEDDTGIVLMAQLRNGAQVPVRLADGTTVSLMFRDAPAIASNWEPYLPGMGALRGVLGIRSPAVAPLPVGGAGGF